MLTRSEMDFLKSQGLTASDVYDGRNQKSAQWKAGVRSEGLTLVLGVPCVRNGHRLRTRSGHCAQCDTSKIAYQNRHRTEGYIYIAGSLSARLLKVGVAVDIEQRLRNLRGQAYGGLRDWQIIYYVKVPDSGRIEADALRRLRSKRVVKSYDKDGTDQAAQELIGATFSVTLDAVSMACNAAKRTNEWRATEWRKYD